MTNPIQKSPGEAPQFPPSSPQSKSKGTADKVSAATGGSQETGVTPAKITSLGLSLPLTPDTQKAVEAVRKKDLVALLAMPSQIRGSVITGLSDNELNALEITSKAFREFHKEITQIKLLREILADHPKWKSTVDGWKDVSVENKIWLLQVYELRDLGVSVNIPSELSLDLLKPETKEAISKVLNNITEVNWSSKKLEKCPKAIGLLSNLKLLLLNYNDLTFPPDVSKNLKLEHLQISNNQLSAPPDISKNVHLKHLQLISNQLKTPPDTSNNVDLETLWLNNNSLTTAPNVSKNVNLEGLYLKNNQLKAAPDLSHNAKLKELWLQKNQLTDPPDTSKNGLLEILELDKNLLTAPPNVSNNIHLQVLNISDNKIKTPPDVSKNGNLQNLDIRNNQLAVPPNVSENGNLLYLLLGKNPLTFEAEQALEQLKLERPTLKILLKEEELW